VSTRETRSLAITGYTEQLSVRPGGTVAFMVSSQFPEYRVEIVRLIHGDTNPAGPGFKSEHVQSDAEKTYKGREQTFHHGSFILVKNKPSLRKLTSFTLQCWIYPTLDESGARAIVGQWSEKKDGSGYGLFVDQGELALWVRGRDGGTTKVRSGKPLKPFNWYFVAASLDSKESKATLVQQVLAPCAATGLDSTVQLQLRIGALGANSADLMIAAFHGKDGKRVASFNGKIDGVKIFSRALTSREIADLKSPSLAKRYARHLVASWDFAHQTQSSRIRDLSRNRLNGVAVNLPVRAVTGHNWSGRQSDYQAAPDEYNAIHFHDDDQGDAGWKVDFRYRVPKELRTGVYAAHLQAGGNEDYIPFFVLPPKGAATAKIAFLVPTLSYLAYSNERTLETTGTKDSLGLKPGFEYPSAPQDVYIVSNRLTSLYDHHSDGSGVCYVTSLRPIVNMRPKYNMPGLSMGNGAPHQFNADLHIIDWMEAKGFRYDVITDEDLHREGEGLIKPYKVIVTGSHPEYWTERMLDSMQGYLNGGGRMMYLGGNGFYWVTTINPEDPHVFEVRRWGGTGTWNAGPGEFRNSTTGEQGGMWRQRGRHPQRSVGVGFTAQGFDANRPYRRTPASFEKRGSFVFEGIGSDELIGDFPSLVQNHGAAGFELDRLDYSLGTPPHAVLLATATGFSNNYQHVLEEITAANDKQGGEFSDLVRADMVYLPYPRGGGVFSVGSIAWGGSLSYNGYNNTVSRVTQNVLSRFESDEALP
jgi:N,N-dimethylformamidase